MSIPWLKNFVGLHQTDFELLRIARPRLELTVHVTAKTIQAGVFLGSLVVGPIIQAISGPRDTKSFQDSMVAGGVRGAQVGLIAGPILTYLTSRSKTDVSIYDRCYRLRFNRPQLMLDRFTLIGGVLGYGIKGATGFVFGVDLALLGLNVLSFVKK